MTALNQKVLRPIKKSFENVYFYWISPASLLNSTDFITLLLIIMNLKNQNEILIFTDSTFSMKKIPCTFKFFHKNYFAGLLILNWMVHRASWQKNIFTYHSSKTKYVLPSSIIIVHLCKNLTANICIYYSLEFQH